MSGLSDELREMLLLHMSRLETDADGLDETLRTYLPHPNHRMALRPEVVIVEGNRGAGKTTLFRLLTESGDQVRDLFRDPGIPEATWVDAYSTNPPHPSELILDQFARSATDGETDAPLRTFWAVHLLQSLTRSGVGRAVLPAALSKVLEEAPLEISRWVPLAERNLAAVIGGLDHVDSALRERGQLVVASYDHLDRLGSLESTSQLRDRLIRALLALWLSLSTRYRHLRSKIFLRPDLLERAQQGFPDASKLRSRTASLEWDVESLYQLAIRHLANRGPHVIKMVEWLRAAGITLRDHPAGSKFGRLPVPLGESGQRELARRLAGVYMGSGPRKGFTYRWLPNHLKDAYGRIVPRSFLRLLGYAAKRALREPGKGEALLQPAHLTAALVETSQDRVHELTEEYTMVKRLENLRGAKVPMKVSDMVKLLAQSSATNDPRQVQGDGGTVLRELRDVGVLEVREDGRIDVPDIFRYGYDIKRPGGAKRPL